METEYIYQDAIFYRVNDVNWESFYVDIWGLRLLVEKMWYTLPSLRMQLATQRWPEWFFVTQKIE